MSDLLVFKGPLIVNSGTEAALLKKIFKTLNIEFIFCNDFDPSYIAYLCSQGFMPMAIIVDGQYYLLIKYHFKRMLITWDQFRYSRSLHKKSLNYILSLNTEFENCLDHIKQQHEDCWIYPPLAAAFKQLNHSPSRGVAFHSVELKKNNQLVAGEIGYTIGSIYASLTGFYTKSGTGTLQLHGLAALLRQNNFTIWDLGMEMPYKHDLGGKSYGRHEFHETYIKVSHKKTGFSKNQYELKKLLTKPNTEKS